MVNHSYTGHQTAPTGGNSRSVYKPPNGPRELKICSLQASIELCSWSMKVSILLRKVSSSAPVLAETDDSNTQQSYSPAPVLAENDDCDNCQSKTSS